MKECASWADCLVNDYANYGQSDVWKAKSLREIALHRIAFLSAVNLTGSNADFFFENYYTSLLEIFHAFLLIKGVKVENHICVGYYIRDVLKREGWFDDFDNFRKKRNQQIYYGKRMNAETALLTVERCKILTKEVNEWVEHEIGQMENKLN